MAGFGVWRGDILATTMSPHLCCPPKLQVFPAQGAEIPQEIPNICYHSMSIFRSQMRRCQRHHTTARIDRGAKSTGNSSPFAMGLQGCTMIARAAQHTAVVNRHSGAEFSFPCAAETPLHHSMQPYLDSCSHDMPRYGRLVPNTHLTHWLMRSGRFNWVTRAPASSRFVQSALGSGCDTSFGKNDCHPPWGSGFILSGQVTCVNVPTPRSAGHCWISLQ